jgi:death on curing protein
VVAWSLSVDDVLRIHDVLIEDFVKSGDPIGTSGVRDMGLLESAVSRQHVGLGTTLKHPDPLGSAATLTFGLCLDHPFVNGNKRTALVALLVHLDRNKLCLYGTSQDDLYALMLGIADHTLGIRVDPRRRDRPLPQRTADDEVAAIKTWLKKRAEQVRRGERPITYRQLRQILGKFGLTLENPNSNTIEVFKNEHRRSGLLRRDRTVKTRIATIGYRDEGTEVSFRDLKNIRDLCSLTEDHGVDSQAFYGDADVIDAFVIRYRAVLRRLAKT